MATVPRFIAKGEIHFCHHVLSGIRRYSDSFRTKAEGLNWRWNSGDGEVVDKIRGGKQYYRQPQSWTAAARKRDGWVTVKISLLRDATLPTPHRSESPNTKEAAVDNQIREDNNSKEGAGRSERKA